MFPKFVMIKQNYPAEKIDNIEEAVRKAVSDSKANLSSVNGKTVGIAIGSRGIANIALIVKTIVSVVKENGGKPIIFAAMGSHGGGTAEGQKDMLKSLGVTEDYTGAEIKTCAESVFYGTAENEMDIYGNKLALEFDKIILINRIKPHTDFEDITESGIFKLMAIGIGNPKGASIIHANALNIGYGPAIRAAGSLMLKKLPVFLAIAITENWKHQTNSIEAVLPENILEAEKRILSNVKKSLVRLPADYMDTLLIRDAGKNISGTCVDTKVVGRIMIAGQKEPEKPKIKTIAVMDFTDESHGNSMGIGIVDVITRRVFNKIDIDATSLTGMTSTCLLQAKIPCVAPNDFEAIKTAFTSSGVMDTENIKAAFIKDTNSLEKMAVSLSLYKEIKENKNIEKISEPFLIDFDSNGNLLNQIDF